MKTNTTVVDKDLWEDLRANAARYLFLKNSVGNIKEWGDHLSMIPRVEWDDTIDASIEHIKERDKNGLRSD